MCSRNVEHPPVTLCLPASLREALLAGVAWAGRAGNRRNEEEMQLQTEMYGQAADRDGCAGQGV